MCHSPAETLPRLPEVGKKRPARVGAQQQDGKREDNERNHKGAVRALTVTTVPKMASM